MPRAATGQVIRRQSGAWALRFRAYGQRRYLTLGTAADGWSHTTASIELQNTLADVRRGIWSPVKPQPKRLPDNDPRFRDFATNWLRMSQPEWEPKTVSDYEWQLVHHLLPFFGDHRLSDITIAEVDRYKQTKASEARILQAAIAEGNVLVTKHVDKNGQKRTRRVRPLSPTSINKTIGRLSQILGVAVEYGLIQSNSAKGRRRRVKARPIRPVWLDSAKHIEALLDAAGELDHPAELKRGHEQRGGLVYRRALLATLIFAGPRIGELDSIELARHRPHGRANPSPGGQDRRWRATDRSSPNATRRAERSQGPRAERESGSVRVPEHKGHPNEPGEHPRPRSPASRSERQRAAPSGREPAAPGWAHSTQAAAHLRLDPHRSWRRPGKRHGPAGSQRSRLHAPPVSPLDAPRRRRSSVAASARRDQTGAASRGTVATVPDVAQTPAGLAGVPQNPTWMYRFLGGRTIALRLQNIVTVRLVWGT